MRYEVWDVFTEAAFGGNPLAVVWDEGLDTPEMQAIASEFGFSETVFLADASPGGARARIFTPTQEVPFAGHPAIGAACALAADGHGPGMVLDLAVGPIRVLAESGGAAFTVPGPLRRIEAIPAHVVAGCTGLAEADLGPCERASVGLPFVIAEVPDATVLSQAAPHVDAFRQAAEDFPSPLDFAIYLWTRTGGEVRARMFAPLDEIPEDPATGSAAAALAALIAEGGGPDRLTVRQGGEMGRPSRILTRAVVEGGAVTEVRVAGPAVRVMSGTLHV
ncbi:trans-2,3-dihydro-3-hydroxyanthranilate isomerase [Hasllibacter halocynthiae]|uniref:Trans-2,3-dihydro-3-hydroxyanthranilate isomerase n=1 Tax=Hasllibacter halocynthiae TaxID=595589 RepID=A0A2T0X7N9_9RHOB|nr:PhzF family phenazine biosynthesis protein [Hasllibacter halocynthiae]PRY94915.1 trans-2,3-dihydro-3-hydroxyanthranilate isomerase [Hasllibacter halocynthiae]